MVALSPAPEAQCAPSHLPGYEPDVDTMLSMPNLMTIHKNRLLDTHQLDHHTLMETNNMIPENVLGPEIEQAPTKPIDLLATYFMNNINPMKKIILGKLL